MVIRLDYAKNKYLNHTGSSLGDYVPCKDNTIGSLIEYLQQFPSTWRISTSSSDRPGDKFVLIDADIATVLTEDGEGPGA